MKIYHAIPAAALALLLPLAAISATGAAPDPSTTTTTTTVPLTPVTYRADVKQIDHVFSQSIDRAHKAFEKALAASTSGTERLSADDAYAKAVLDATNAREDALVALGTPPTDTTTTTSPGLAIGLSL